VRLSPADFRSLVVFRSIVEHRGFTGAQLALGMSQSTISFHLKALEDRLGFQLCLRGRGGFRLTHRGQEVFERSKSLIAAISNFEHTLGELRGRVVGTLRVGFVDNTMTNPDLPLDSIIRSCLLSAPDADIQLVIADPEILIAEIVNGGVDVAVAPQIDVVSGLKQTHFYDEPHSLYCAESHPLFSGKSEPTNAEVERHAFVVRPYANKRELHHFPNAKVRAHASNMEAQAAFILSGQMIGYLPDHFAARWVSTGRIREVIPSARLTSPFVHISSGDAPPSPLLKLFLREISKQTVGTRTAH
jgi:LysR family transcriptional regulator, transcriptional activator for bauABCD operon